MAPNSSILQFALLILISSLLIPTPILSYTVFNFTSFTPNTRGINFSGDAYASGSNHIIQLTRNQVDLNLFSSVGHAVYSNPIQLWSTDSGGVADFVTNFKFNIKVLNERFYGDGIAFFMAPVGYKIPHESSGKFLGLFNSTSVDIAPIELVAVEFDTFWNEWDTDGNHIGINIGSLVSKATTTSDMKNDSTASARVEYNSTRKELSVYLMYNDTDWYNGNPAMLYNLNMKDVLPEKVIVGFSASTGGSTELHQIVSWDFSSSFVESDQGKNKNNSSEGKYKSWVVAVLVLIGIGLVGVIGYLFLLRRKKQAQEAHGFVLDASLENALVMGTGPRRFSYKELVMATDNFNEDGKLGQGGFGKVYIGILEGNQEKIAVKKIIKGSSQGKKEYISEVTVINRLRHRNLVKPYWLVS